MRRRALGLAVAALAAAAAVGAVALSVRPSPKPATSVSTTASQIGGPFALVDLDGKPVTDRDLIGRPTVIYFGFTYCPEVCPTTLASLTQWLKALGRDADKLNLAFITIDPERDTPAQMKRYLKAFDPRLRGLTGSPSQVEQAAHQYLVFYTKVDLGRGAYTMDHSTSMYLMDRQGHLADVIAYQEPSNDAIDKLRRLAKAGWRRDEDVRRD
jgi:protein SCO1/2